MAQSLRHTWSPMPINAGADRFWTLAQQRLLPPALATREDARTTVQPPTRLTLAVIVASLGLVCGALGGGLIGVIVAQGVAVGTPLTLGMVLGRAGGGTLWGVVIGGFVAVNTVWGSAQDGAQTAPSNRSGAVRTPLARTVRSWQSRGTRDSRRPWRRHDDARHPRVLAPRCAHTNDGIEQQQQRADERTPFVGTLHNARVIVP